MGTLSLFGLMSVEMFCGMIQKGSYFLLFKLSECPLMFSNWSLFRDSAAETGSCTKMDVHSSTTLKITKLNKFFLLPKFENHSLLPDLMDPLQLSPPSPSCCTRLFDWSIDYRNLTWKISGTFKQWSFPPSSWLQCRLQCVWHQRKLRVALFGLTQQYTEIHLLSIREEKVSLATHLLKRTCHHPENTKSNPSVDMYVQHHDLKLLNTFLRRT